MALSTCKLSDLQFSHPSINLLFTPKTSICRFKLFFSTTSSHRTAPQNPKPNPNPNPNYRNSDENRRKSPSISTKSTPPSAPWLRKWPSPSTTIDASTTEKTTAEKDATEIRYFDGGDRGRTALGRIVHRLRNLELGTQDVEEDLDSSNGMLPLDGGERLGDLLARRWARPDSIERNDQGKYELLPWEKGTANERGYEGEEVASKDSKKRRVTAPTLAELTIEDSELKRLRRDGMVLRERISVPKAGITQAVLDKIHDGWRKSELVRLKFHETLAHDMKTAHEIVERRSGGLVIWRAGSVMVVYRGSTYQRPSSRSQSVVKESNSTEKLPEGGTLFIPDVSTANNLVEKDGIPVISLTTEKAKLSVMSPNLVESSTEEETEYNSLLDGLGPRFVEWWGTGFLPVDADLLPQNIPGYKTPFRLLPNRMRARLTNAELTSLRKVARSLPCHFALGRNRNHHGLAAAIVKLWNKSIVVKIAVKRGIQNTNNKLMAEELKMLTGGILLLRNKYYIVIYRGKDFVPTTVATALTERQELTKEIQDVEEKARSGAVEATHIEKIEGQALAGTLAEFHEAQARWGREISAEEHKKMKEEASRARSIKLVKRIGHKLELAQAKMLRAERLLSKIEASMVPVGPSDDQETITDEERFMFRRVGLRMTAYLPLGIRGVFDGVIENMHLHWKHRELVKLISKQKTLSFVEDTARLLEYESGGILVAIERVPKGYALIYYRGKNYQRPISLRPRNLLTKAKALKRSVAMQRHEALSQHISELEATIDQMKAELGDSKDTEERSTWSEEEQIEDEGSYYESDDDDDGDDDDDYVDDNEISDNEDSEC